MVPHRSLWRTSLRFQWHRRQAMVDNLVRTARVRKAPSCRARQKWRESYLEGLERFRARDERAILIIVLAGILWHTC